MIGRLVAIGSGTPRNSASSRASVRRGRKGEKKGQEDKGANTTRPVRVDFTISVAVHGEFEREIPVVLRDIIRCKTRAFKVLSKYYGDMMFCKDKFRIYAGLQVTEVSLIKSFKAKFVDRYQNMNITPRDCVIFWGDWSKRDGFRHQPPVPSVRLRKLFRKAGFVVLLVDESRVSGGAMFSDRFDRV